MELQITGYVFLQFARYVFYNEYEAVAVAVAVPCRAEREKKDREKVIMPTGSFSYNYT